MKSIRKILENNGFAITKTKDGYELQQYTPAGEDWLIYLSKLKDLKEYAENFDPEDDFEMWIEAKRNGVAGVPEASELWRDQLWKQEKLNKIVGELK